VGSISSLDNDIRVNPGRPRVCIPDSTPASIMEKIPGGAHLNLTVGGLAILGGAAGFARKGSKASLVAGLSVGGLLLGSGYLIAFSDDSVYRGYLLGAASSGLMAAAMGQRYMKTSKMMPAGAVAILGAATCAYNLHKSREWA
jgi:uncharacterized membrane protein (UPF0136 family)